MKILVVNLLRLGDIIMTAPVISGLKQKYPEAEIHLLINSQFRKVACLLPNVDEVHCLNRNELQTKLGNYQYHILEAAEDLEKQLDRVNANSFSKIVNLTQNKLSGWVCSYLTADEKIGLHYNFNGQAYFGSSWLNYLNDHVKAGAKDFFHYTDIFCEALELQKNNRKIKLNHSVEAAHEAEKITANFKQYICLQALSSDKKKDLDTSFTIKMLKSFTELEPNMSILLLGAPGEEKKLASILDELPGLPIVTCICSLEVALCLIEKSQLLLSVDTSIKHLGAATGTKIIEVALGSSDIRKTGVFKENSLIVTSQESCAPCAHEESCHREQRFCGKSLNPVAMAVLMKHFIFSDYTGVRCIAKEYAESMKVLRTHFSETGYWALQDMSSDNPVLSLQNFVNRMSWKMLLSGEYKALVAEYGSESLRLKKYIEKYYPDYDRNKLLQQIASLAKSQEKSELALSKLKLQLANYLRGQGMEPFSTLEGIAASVDIENRSRHLEELLQNLSSTKGDFLKLRRAQQEIQSISRRHEIKSKLLRTLRSQLLEVL